MKQAIVTKVAVRSLIRMLMLLVPIVGRGEATSRKLSAVSTQTRLDAKTGIEVPVEENIDVIQWVEDPAEFIYKCCAQAEVDYVPLRTVR